MNLSKNGSKKGRILSEDLSKPFFPYDDIIYSRYWLAAVFKRAEDISSMIIS
jgi:hypothetical protein